MNMYLSGLILISPALNFQTLRFNPGNDLPCVLYVPTYKPATALYHKKPSPELQTNGNELEKAEALGGKCAICWCPAQRSQTVGSRATNIAEILRFIPALSKSFVENSNLRINQLRFAKELLRSEQRTVGILDGRVKGIDSHSAGEIQLH